MADEVRSTYDTVAADYAARFPGTEPEQAVDLAMVEYFVSVLPGEAKRVLDAGCGTGRMCRYLADRGCHVRGVDLSPGMIAIAHRDHPDIDTRVASVTELPFPDDEFDGLFFWYSIIHVPDADLPAAFREARRVLRRNGVILVAFQTGDGARDVAAGYRKLGHDVTLTRFHRWPDHVGRFLEDAHFAEIARLVREPLAGERDGQAVLVARVGDDNS